MSSETKVGLLISLGVILAFAMILSMNLSREEYADSGGRLDGAHTAQYGNLPRTGDGSAPGRTEDTTSETSTDGGDIGPAPGGREDADTAGSDLAEADDEDRGLMVAGGRTSEARHDDATDTESDGSVEHRDELPEPEPQPALERYTVKSGDRLYTIAEKYFGPRGGPQWRKIAEANPGVDPHNLSPGTELIIPVVQRRVEPVVPAPQPDGGRTPTETTTDVYVVAQNDTLGDISTKRYGTCKKWRLILDANPGINPRCLPVGKKLVIPREGSAPVTVADSGATTDADEAVDRALDEVQRFVADSRGLPAHSSHTVVADDTLQSISRKYFGTSRRWKEIHELNRDKVADPGRIAVGQVLRIPATTRTALASTAGAQP